MTREKVKELLPVLEAYANGKTIVTNFDEKQRNQFFGSMTKGVLHTFIGS